jgi:class 3 adenylate cyclase
LSVAEAIERKLVAILAADIVAFSRLTSMDEEGTLRRVVALRSEVIDPVTAAHHGRVVKTMGDGFIVEFASIVDAVRAAIELQRRFAAENSHVPREARIEFRVGIHLGDVVVQSDGDLLGDGVNIAARLEALADPGGICISEDAYRQVRDRVDRRFIDLGEKQLKNIAHPMRIYTVETVASASPPGKAAAAEKPTRRRQPKVKKTDHAAAALSEPVRLRAPGRRLRIATAQEAIAFIDKGMPKELATLPRWTFARALMVEAIKTGKSRDLTTATRQFRQAASNERWLDQDHPEQASQGSK